MVLAAAARTLSGGPRFVKPATWPAEWRATTPMAPRWVVAAELGRLLLRERFQGQDAIRASETAIVMDFLELEPVREARVERRVDGVEGRGLSDRRAVRDRLDEGERVVEDRRCVRRHAVHETPRERLRRADATREEDHLLGAPSADDARQPLRPARSGD